MFGPAARGNLGGALGPPQFTISTSTRPIFFGPTQGPHRPLTSDATQYETRRGCSRGLSS